MTMQCITINWWDMVVIRPADAFLHYPLGMGHNKQTQTAGCVNPDGADVHVSRIYVATKPYGNHTATNTNCDEPIVFYQ